MKTIITLLCLSASLCLSSQCVYIKNEVDEFTGLKVKETEDASLYYTLFGQMKVSFRAIDDNYYLKLYFSSSSIWSISEGSELMLKLQDSSIVSVKCVERVVADYIVSGSSTLWYGYIKFNITKADLINLGTKDLLKLRLYTTDGYIEKDIKAAKTQSIKELATCIYMN